MRIALAAGLVLLASAGAGPRAAKPVAPIEKPRLAVVIAIDGLSWDRLNSWRPWFTGGLKRLLDEGAVATQCRYEHLDTFTAPGHASLATGAPPRVHGVPLNHWWVPAADGSAMVSVYAASQPAAGGAEGAPTTVLGAGRLRVPTLADRLETLHPGAKVVSIANKDRAAILLAGRDPRHAVYWYADGTYVTSDAYDRTSPEGVAAARVVGRFNQDEAGEGLAAHFGTTWYRLPVPEAVSAPAPAVGADGGLRMLQDPVIGSVFPHPLVSKTQTLAESILWTPYADELLTDLALDLLEDDDLALGRDEVPDMLAVSYSASDYASHSYGPESLEELEVLRGLDASLGRLLDALTERVGKDRVMVALSTDHGFLPLQAVTRRISEQKLRDELNAAVNAKLKRTQGPPLVHSIEGGSLWLNRVALAAPGAPAAAKVLDAVKGELAAKWKDVIAPPSDADLRRRLKNAIVPGRSGDLFVVLRAGVVWDYGDGRGTTHGSPWEYDVHVPLIFWGGGTVPREVSSPTTPYDLAPTLAAWLGISLPDATGKRR